MKTLLWALAVYEVSIGVAELLWVKTQSPALATIAALPSVGSLIDPMIAKVAPDQANYIEGALDFAMAGTMVYFVLKGRG